MNTSELNQMTIDTAFYFGEGVLAARSLKEGDIFRGSMGEAEHVGLTGEAADMFSLGYYREIENKSIHVNEAGIITMIN